MNNRHKKSRLVFFAAVACGLALTGCHKKKPNVPPPQAEAPPISTPAPAPQPAVVPPPVAPPTTTEQPAQQPTATKQKSKPKHSVKTAKTGSSNKVVVEDGGESSSPPPEISVGMDKSEAAHERQTTEQLLQSADANLKGLNRTLTSDELAMVEQIKQYMSQSRAAMNDGDLVRANNLALKAHLLSDALSKH